ncbi:Endonuclease/exonuclease/phosphatase [Rhypophila sp. PSN 637]
MKHILNQTVAAASLLVPMAMSQGGPTFGKFNILAMNVAGLPAFLNPNDVPGDKSTNAKTIGAKFSQYNYDVIHMQEDFNYHADVYSTNKHPHRTPTSGGVPFGSGLNTLSNFEYLDFRRIKWATCSDASSADCLTPKGFTFMRVALSPQDNSTAVYADFYNLHADAGTEPQDNAARQSNINQVLSYLNTWSIGNPVFIFGDFNSRYSRTVDTAIRNLLSAGFSDPWVELQRDGVVPTAESLCSNPSTTDSCETVDKVFYRSSPLLKLTATEYTYASKLFLQADGKSVLSDHNPVQANFTWSSGGSSLLRQSPLWGGPYGTWFSDVPSLSSSLNNNYQKIKTTTINLRGSARVDSVGVTLSNGQTFTHGGNGGSLSTLALGANEFWTRAKLCQAQRSGRTRIFYIRATTSSGRSIATGAEQQNAVDCRTYDAPAGWQIVGFLGQDGDEVDQLGFVYAPR